MAKRFSENDIEQILKEPKEQGISFEEKIENFFQKQKITLIFLSIGVLLISIGYAAVFGKGKTKEEERVVFETDDSKEEKEKATSIFVDVSGAVEKPGVYDLGSEARVKDALIAAGGLALSADREFVSKKMNLAALLPDGAKIYIPETGESGESGGINKSDGTGIMINGEIAGVSTQNSGLVNINTAGAAELEKLKGIGPVRAQAIIDNRPYSSIDDLRTKGVLGQKTFENIKEGIAVY